MIVPFGMAWWRHQMETFSALLALCAGNSPVNGEFPSQRPVTRSFDIFFDLRLNKRSSKQARGWWFETPSRLYDVTVMGSDPVYSKNSATKVLERRRFRLSTFWFVDVSICRRFGLSTFRFVDVSFCRPFGCRRFGLSTFWQVFYVREIINYHCTKHSYVFLFIWSNGKFRVCAHLFGVMCGVSTNYINIVYGQEIVMTMWNWHNAQ